MDFDGWDPAVRDAVLLTMAARVPEASREVYMTEWIVFQKWRASTNPPFAGPTKSKHIHGYLASRYTEGSWKTSSTLWSKLSILRTMAHIVEKSNVKDDPDDLNIQAWLKSLGKGQKPKQSATFTRSDVQKYLTETAHDALSLPARLLLLVGCNTGGRSQTLYNLEHRHIQETETGDLRVTVDYAQKHDQGAMGQTWIVKKNVDNKNLCAATLYQEYRGLAIKAGLQHDWLWRKLYMTRGELKMKNGRLGENWVAGLPRVVAEHLKLECPLQYTGHALRRTCAVWHADSGATDQEMRIHFGWKNTSMASRYTSSSETARAQAAERTFLKITKEEEVLIPSNETPNISPEKEELDKPLELYERPPVPFPSIIKQCELNTPLRATSVLSSLYNLGGAQINVLNIYNELPTIHQKNKERNETSEEQNKEEIKDEPMCKKVRLIFRE